MSHCDEVPLDSLQLAEVRGTYSVGKNITVVNDQIYCRVRIRIRYRG